LEEGFGGAGRGLAREAGAKIPAIAAIIRPEETLSRPAEGGSAKIIDTFERGTRTQFQAISASGGIVGRGGSQSFGAD